MPKSLKKNTILVFHPSISQPTEVRHAWAANPDGVNLYNKEDLPASIFKTGKLI